MPTVHLGRKNEPAYRLERSPDLIAVRTRSGRSVTRSTAGPRTAAAAEVDDGSLVLAFPDAGVEVYRVPTTRGARSLAQRKSALRASPDVRFAGGVFVDAVAKKPVVYTENLFIKFTDATDPDDALAVLRDAGLAVKQNVGYATNAYFVAAPEGTGEAVFEIAERLLQRDDVEYCHPELIRERAMKAIAPSQWHLAKTTIAGRVVDAHAGVAAAHAIAQGAGTTIAIIDTGIDIDHVEFGGGGKIVAPRDATGKTADPRPVAASESHGTACAGVACASGSDGASGVAPQARLMPIRLRSGLGSQNEADAFKWAADHGADVISCSWGPADGDWFDPADPVHDQFAPLGAQTRLAIDYATTHGRNGKGCVILFAAGNGNESVDNDGYASYARVIAVAACNDRGLRSVYSDFGAAIWCAFPSSDFGHAPFNHPEPLTPGIWTTDRSGAPGYNDGRASQGDVRGDYTNGFGGTSSACPGAAGVAALVLSVNPALRWHEVRDVLARACDRIDPQGGAYDAAGRSSKYGHGRLNALAAVTLAQPEPQNVADVTRVFNAPVPDLQTVTFTLDVADATPIESAVVQIDLRHTYVGDLVVTLRPPEATGAGAIVLHDRAGGPAHDIRRSYDTTAAPALANVVGKSGKGTWTLEIRDAAAQDSGRLVSFGVRLGFAHPDRVAPAAPVAVAKRAPARRTVAKKAAARPKAAPRRKRV
ncbi:MAG TPA: S8 family serine peptidase [Tahibacter sp.]|uniref:S8 family serine peptidase n=1 Tax=Tahibacter sp. TaxID=2056211 RepID=UPI002B84FB8F|nr:S8 family serine peptidase [Tahibacter sp.]HSX61507.1 S8 family serine peptidase [Tahibacter sp.]